MRWLLKGGGNSSDFSALIWQFPCTVYRRIAQKKARITEKNILKPSDTVSHTYLLKVDVSSNKNTVRYFAKRKKSQCNPLVGNSIVWFISKETSRFAVVKNRRNGIGLPNRHKLSYCKIDFWRLVAGETVEFWGRVTKNGDQERIQ